MDKMRLPRVTTLLVVLAAFSLESFAQGPSVEGGWIGAIEIPDIPLSVAVTLDQDDDGWAGTIDIPAQNAQGAPLTGIEVGLSFTILGAPGSPTFKGNVSDDGTTLSGTFSQNAASFPFQLDRSERDTVVESFTVVSGDAVRFEGLWSGTVECRAGESPADHPRDSSRPRRLFCNDGQSGSGSYRYSHRHPECGRKRGPVRAEPAHGLVRGNSQ